VAHQTSDLHGSWYRTLGAATCGWPDMAKLTSDFLVFFFETQHRMPLKYHQDETADISL
jgi:hypothetical protein